MTKEVLSYFWEKIKALVNANKPTDLVGTLEVGSTSITLTDDIITTDNTYDIYTSIYGVTPTDISIIDGSITLTFEEQESAISVKVRIS